MKKKAVRIQQFLTVEVVPIDSIKPHPRNPRLHSQDNLQVIANSLKEYGQKQTLVVWRDLIIVGNGRWMAAKQLLGWKKIAITRADELSEDRAMAYAIADNKTTDTSEFDYEIVADVIKELDAKGLDVSRLTGFAEYEIEPLRMKEFQPDGIGKLLEDDEAKQRTITFSPEQWEVAESHVQEAIEKGYVREGAEDNFTILGILVMVIERRRKQNMKKKKAVKKI